MRRHGEHLLRIIGSDSHEEYSAVSEREALAIIYLDLAANELRPFS